MIQNITELVWVAKGAEFPQEARAIITTAGPRPRRRSLKMDDRVLAANTAATTSSGTSSSTTTSGSSREVALFVCCDTPPSKWGAFVAEIVSHAANLSEIILSPYELSKNGTLITQGTVAEHTAALAAAAQLRNATSSSPSSVGLRTTALVACDPGGVRRLIYDGAAAKAFIATAVATLESTGLQVSGAWSSSLCCLPACLPAIGSDTYLLG